MKEASDSDTKLSDELEFAKSLLVRTCVDWMSADILNPRPECCPYQRAAKIIKDAQELLRTLDK